MVINIWDDKYGNEIANNVGWMHNNNDNDENNDNLAHLVDIMTSLSFEWNRWKLYEFHNPLTDFWHLHYFNVKGSINTSMLHLSRLQNIIEILQMQNFHKFPIGQYDC